VARRVSDYFSSYLVIFAESLKVPYLLLKSPVDHEPSVAIVVSANVVDRSIGTDNPRLLFRTLWFLDNHVTHLTFEIGIRARRLRLAREDVLLLYSPVGSPITPPPLSESSSDTEAPTPIVVDGTLEVPPAGNTYEKKAFYNLHALVSERFGRGARDARPDDGVDGSAASGESQPPKPPGSPSSSQ
ncbi:hypothetical protein Tco_0500876, partial [Tanacetum coccineum]